jgi:hypothetical protein
LSPNTACSSAGDVCSVCSPALASFGAAVYAPPVAIMGPVWIVLQRWDCLCLLVFRAELPWLKNTVPNSMCRGEGFVINGIDSYVCIRRPVHRIRKLQPVGLVGFGSFSAIALILSLPSLFPLHLTTHPFRFSTLPHQAKEPSLSELSGWYATRQNIKTLSELSATTLVKSQLTVLPRTKGSPHHPVEKGVDTLVDLPWLYWPAPTGLRRWFWNP